MMLYLQAVGFVATVLLITLGLTVIIRALVGYFNKEW